MIFEVDSGDYGFGVEAEKCVAQYDMVRLIDIINQVHLI